MLTSLLCFQQIKYKRKPIDLLLWIPLPYFPIIFYYFFETPPHILLSSENGYRR